MAEPLFSLTYVSSAVRPFSDADLVALLHQSRAKNERLGITGMLLYEDGSFIQVLEGPENAVRSLYATIEADARHRGVISLVEERLTERQFPQWSMGFRNLRDPGLRDLPGYDEFMNLSLAAPEFRSDPSRARRLLAVFRRNMLR